MDFQPEIIKKLGDQYGFVTKKNWLQNGRCPECKKNELYARADKTYWIKCGRLNNCGYSADVKDLYPEIFENFNDKYQSTESDPQATADAYMSHGRGFNISKIRDWYEQGNFWHPSGDRGTATVRFFIDDAKTVYFERLIAPVVITDPKTGDRKKRKAHYVGSYKNKVWEIPGVDYFAPGDIYIVESILDAIALHFIGVRAVAVLGASNYPEEWFERFADKAGIRFIWAMDNDNAGKKYTRRNVKTMREHGGFDVAAIQAPSAVKEDWNDLYARDQLTLDTLDDYRYYGDLLTAESAIDKALIMYNKKGRLKFHFDFYNCIYWFNLDIDKLNKVEQMIEENDDTGMTQEGIRDEALKQSGAIRRILNAMPKWLYYQYNELTDESWYYVELQRPDGLPSVQNTFTASQIAASAEFKKRLLHIAPSALWKGNAEQLDAIIETMHNLKTVETIDYIGYSPKHQSWIFNDLAIHKGNAHPINAENYFSLPKMNVKTLSQSPELEINEHGNGEFLNTLIGAYGYKGVCCLAFWLGSLFAEQIRKEQKSFPFIEIVGEPGSGKSTLIEFLWQLFGRSEYEGFDPAKSTNAAFKRNMGQVSNLPVVLIEGDREGGKQFMWDMLKTAYNGRAITSRGVKNGGNETYEPPFRGTVVISQNASLDDCASDAMLQRIVHIEINKSEHSASTKENAEILERMPMEKVSGFILKACTAEKQILETLFNRASYWAEILNNDPDIAHVRIAKNHGQLMALVEALKHVTDITDNDVLNTHELIIDLAKQRRTVINADNPIVTQFWETYHWLNEGDRLNHHRDENKIAINLNEYIARCKEKGQELPTMAELKKHLKNSKKHLFIEVKSVNSKHVDQNDHNQSKTKYCWIFEA